MHGGVLPLAGGAGDDATPLLTCPAPTPASGPAPDAAAARARRSPDAAPHAAAHPPAAAMAYESSQDASQYDTGEWITGDVSQDPNAQPQLRPLQRAVRGAHLGISWAAGATNFGKEVLQTRSVCDMFTRCRVQWAPELRKGGSGGNVSYDSVSLTEFGALSIVKGTFFGSPFLYLQTSLIMLFGFAVFSVVYYSPDEYIHAERIDTDALSQSRDILVTLVSFLLGLFVSKTLDRWWVLRTECVGAIWGASVDLALILGTHVRRRELRAHVNRLAAASFAVAVLEAQGRGERVGDLEARGLLTRQEYRRLQGLEVKGQVIWAWVWRLLWRAHECGEIAGADALLLQQLRGICVLASGRVGKLFAVLCCQLPLFYVHCICATVKILFLSSAVLSGVISAAASAKGNGALIFQQFFFHLFVVPFVFQAVLEVHKRLQNPFTQVEPFNRSSFPYDLYERGMLSEGATLGDAADRAPLPPYLRPDPPPAAAAGRRGSGAPLGGGAAAPAPTRDGPRAREGRAADSPTPQPPACLAAS